jgi:intron-binding protein aquarius
MISEAELHKLVVETSQPSTRAHACQTLHVQHHLPLWKDGTLHKSSLQELLLQRLEYFVRFPYDEQENVELSGLQSIANYEYEAQILQRIAFRLFPMQLKELVCAPLSDLQNPRVLKELLGNLNQEEMKTLAVELRLIKKSEAKDIDDELLLRIFYDAYCSKPSHSSKDIKDMSLYPTEDLLLYNEFVQTKDYDNSKPSHLPVLTPQFLSFGDYLIRNFQLYRLESAFQFGEELTMVIEETQPTSALGESNVRFKHWHRNSLPLSRFQVSHVGKIGIGQKFRESVLADVIVDLSYFSNHQEVYSEWDALKTHDVLFLVSVSVKFEDGFEISFVRGCEIVHVKDEKGNILNKHNDEGVILSSKKAGSYRNFRVKLDPVQYEQDLQIQSESGVDMYESFNILVKRDPDQCSFKAVLDTIRQIISSNSADLLPKWISTVVLGFGDHDEDIPGSEENFIFNITNTFQDLKHLKSIWNTSDGVKIQAECKSFDSCEISVPKSLFFSAPESEDSRPKKRQRGKAKSKKENVLTIRQTQSQKYTASVINGARFEASEGKFLLRALFRGLTLANYENSISHYDLLAQLILNISASFPKSKILLVCRSNKFLNAICDQVLQRGFDEAYFLRLGQGETAMSDSRDFSKFGRVNFMLQKRLDLLQEVRRIATVLENSASSGTGYGGSDHSIAEAAGYSCDAAKHYFLYRIEPLWQEFKKKAKTGGISELLSQFPFRNVFVNLSVSENLSLDEFEQIAESIHMRIVATFELLSECKFLEILRRYEDRANFMLTKHAQVISMTSTYAAINRENLMKSGFSFSSLIIDESESMMDFEAILPCFLQENVSNLERMIILGSRSSSALNSLVKSPVLREFSNLSRPLLSRLELNGNEILSL